MERSQWESSPPSVCIAFGGQKVMSDHWNFLVRASYLSPSLSDNPFLTVSSPHAHTDTDTCMHTCTHSYTWTHKHTHMPTLPSSSVAWSSCKVSKSASYILGRWERTSWKQWNGLICGFAGEFDKGPCSKPKFLWPLVKNSPYLPLPPLFFLWIGWEWITRGAVSLIKLFSLLHAPLLLSLHLLSHMHPDNPHILFLLALWHNRYL